MPEKITSENATNPGWYPVHRDKVDIKNGYNLCPKCKQETCEYYMDWSEENPDQLIQIKERCTQGCFVFDFEKMERIA